MKKTLKIFNIFLFITIMHEGYCASFPKDDEETAANALIISSAHKNVSQVLTTNVHLDAPQEDITYSASTYKELDDFIEKTESYAYR